MATLTLVQEEPCGCGQPDCFQCSPLLSEALELLGPPHALEGLAAYLARAARAKENRARYPRLAPAVAAQADEAIREHDRCRTAKRRITL